MVMRATGPLLLAIDTSTRLIGLALYDGAQVLSETVWTSHDYHTVELAPAVAEILRRCGVNAGSLGAIAVALGPGSFTGLRIGLALAKGLALARRLPLIGVPTLDILAAAQPALLEAFPASSQAVAPELQPAEARLAAVLHAGRGRLAVGWYASKAGAWKPAGQLEVLSPAALAERIRFPALVCGELSGEERELLGRVPGVRLSSPAYSLRRPGFLAELGWRRWKAGQVDAPAGLAPIYLHYPESSAVPDVAPGAEVASA